MKRLVCFVSTVLLLACLLMPTSALAYLDSQMQTTYSDDDLPLVYGTLNRRMATRTGPSTGYPEPGTFFTAGDSVRIIALTYDENGVPWVQVDLSTNRYHLRAYTGLKRFDGVEPADLPREANYGYEAVLTRDVQPLCGPGAGYSSYTFTMRAGRTVYVMDFEGDYAICDFYAAYDGEWNRVWIPMNCLTFN